MMWTVKPAPIPVQFRRGLTGTISVCYSQLPPLCYDETPRRFYNIPAKSQTSESESVVGVLGQKILLRSGSDSNSKNKPIAKEKEKEMSGADVLWAIQRATAQRKKRSNADERKKKTKIELLSSAVESSGDNGVDYSNVRPVRIKTDWGQRLEEFDKVLKEFQETAL